MTKSNIYIFNIYRAPLGNFQIFLLLENILMLFMNPNPEFIIGSDTNINYLVGTYRKSQLNSLLISYSLFDTVGFPTRIQNTTISATDNTLRDFYSQGNFVIFPVYNGLSGHDAQLIMMHDTCLYEHIYNIINIRIINGNLLNDFKYGLSFELWEDIFSEEEVNYHM
jgi:hypothetical protein